MNTVDYPVGASIWQELWVQKEDGVAEFYQAVLGWALEGSGAHQLFRRNGALVAGLRVDAALDPADAGWVVYIGAEDLEKATHRAVGAGAQVMIDSIELTNGQEGRILIDPFGARFGLALFAAGAAVPPSYEVGHMALVDPTNHDLDAQVAFQHALFPGTTLDALDHGIHFFRDASGFALRGAYEVGEELRAFLPPHWLPWFVVADQTIAVDTAASTGGRVNTRDNLLSFGVWGVVVDPQGGEFKTLQMTRPTL